ncbi:pyruvate dehydrogenase (acetyl-transferring) E1 component subunit alpha [Patescibacteria group bacterium]|nr:pyruvate dehydrogenase (acetyl-transferring) E1 component subunit alpha [Patescibacteria group bacterium]MBU1703224.1 pyruvate dehydrogenase (acetyl-transferring) E1 component subunit alpha [Patescibacteria group bacterium]MBU1953848.1 pyruvate dehydrogenase (acetyl-transferring) E1 component subunit alpha [Patescibacteria group bacterium]
MFLEKYDPLKNQMVQILDQDGNHKEDLLPKEMTDDVVKDLYEQMVFYRMCDKRMLKMQRTGRMGTFAPLEGQEAAQIGSEFAMKKTDWMVPAFRELAAMCAHGVPVETFFLFWRGNEIGSKYPKDVKVLPSSIPVGSQMLHAVGISLASKLRKEKDITVTYFGDGATSEGDFHEAMNFAGVFKTPTVFICQNNQYAISVPRSKQTASETIAQKAIAYGFPGVLVDGNDLFAMFAVTKEAAERARKGGGPTLIEAYTYRLADHTTADDSTKYRTQEEVDGWRKRDPLLRLQKYLFKKGAWTEKYEAALQENLLKKVDEITEKVEATADQTVDSMFDYLFAEPTQELLEQKAYLKKMLELENKK